MSDGASYGVGPERALGTILGGERQPDEDPASSSEVRSPEAWQRLLSEKDDNINGYDAHAEVLAKYIMLAIQANPGLAQVPITPVWLIRDGQTDYNIRLLPDWGDVLKQLHPEDHPAIQALRVATGFSYGWAVNMARYALGLHEQPNPAILTIG